jgi:hypothetical protein
MDFEIFARIGLGVEALACLDRIPSGRLSRTSFVAISCYVAIGFGTLCGGPMD